MTEEQSENYIENNCIGTKCSECVVRAYCFNKFADVGEQYELDFNQVK